MPLQSRHRIVRIRSHEGRLHFEGLGGWHTYLRDPYHFMQVIPWPIFLGTIALLYIGINLFFTALFMLDKNGVANARSVLDIYFFSVQTFASIGYGAMYPTTLYTNAIVSLEAMMGLVSIALLTGISFARFSRSVSRVMFSKNAVVTTLNGKPTLMIRAANERGNEVVEAQVRMHLLRDEITQEGEHVRRIYDLKLLRDRSYSFRLSWTIYHPIDADSPLFEQQPKALVDQHVNLVVTIHGHDQTVEQPIHARHDYGAQDIQWNYRFVDMVRLLPDGSRLIDYSKFHETQKVEEALHSELSDQ